MSDTKIEVPAEHVEAVRQSLLARRSAAGAQAETERLLRQLSGADGAAPCPLEGPRELIWSAVYDSVCEAAEQLADDLNEYWRGGAAADAARARIAVVGARFELLTGLGAPPAR